MNIFICWGGDASKRIAEAFRDWLPQVIQAIQPWMSDRDIDKGARWIEEVGNKLEQGQFGIVCLTQDNLKAEDHVPPAVEGSEQLLMENTLSDIPLLGQLAVARFVQVTFE